MAAFGRTNAGNYYDSLETKIKWIDAVTVQDERGSNNADKMQCIGQAVSNAPGRIRGGGAESPSVRMVCTGK